jgi:hypothetical protein
MFRPVGHFVIVGLVAAHRWQLPDQLILKQLVKAG